VTQDPIQQNPQQESPQQEGHWPPEHVGTLPPRQGHWPLSAPKSSHALRNGLIILLAAVVVICGGLVLASAIGGKATSTSNAKVTHGMNEAVRDGQFEFVVTSMTCGHSMEGDEIPDGAFCEVGVSVKNIGNKAQLFDGAVQKATGSTGSVYSDDPAAEVYANGLALSFLDHINPGNHMAGVLVYDIPQYTTLTSITLHDSPYSHGVTVALS